MFSALGIGRSGLHANQYKLDSVADEIANVSTDGYKRSNVSFQELLPGEDITLGTKAGIRKLDFSQGVPRETGYRWDFAIEGDGFFSVVNADGDAFFTRDGAFQMSQEGALVDYAGNAAGALGADAWLVSSNPFDVIGAISSGMRAAWIKRSPEALFDPWGIEPTLTVNGLSTLAEQIGQECRYA